MSNLHINQWKDHAKDQVNQEAIERKRQTITALKAIDPSFEYVEPINLNQKAK